MTHYRTTIRVHVEHFVPATGQTVNSAFMIPAKEIEMSGKPLGQMLAEGIARSEAIIEAKLNPAETTTTTKPDEAKDTQ